MRTIPPSPPVSNQVSFHGGPVGASATIERKPRQGRKAATVSFDSGAGVTLAGLPPFWAGQAAVPGRLSCPAIHGRALIGARDAIRGIAQARRLALRDDRSKTPPGPEGSNGIVRFGRRSHAGGAAAFLRA